MESLFAWLQAHRWMALAGSMAVLCSYVVLGELLPQAADVYRLYRDWQYQQSRVASAEDWEEEQIRLGVRKRRLQQRFASLYVSLPRSDNMSTILQTLQQSRDKEHVALEEIRPTERMAFANYEELPFQVTLRGSFHRVVAFISRIEQSPLVIKVRKLSLRRPAASSAELHAELTLSVIILKEQAETR